jgi:outer membrane lipoprotein-sorting protein
MRKAAILTLAALALLPRAPARADDLDGRAIAEKLDKSNRPKDEVDRITMQVIDKAGTSRKRELSIYFLAGEGSDCKILARFESGDVKGLGLLTLEEGGKDEQWIYLPELRKTKRVAGSGKAQSFAGTDFSNYDMRTEDLAAHDYKRLPDETRDGRACYVLEVVPKSKDVEEETGYSRRKIWVDKERFTVPRGEYFDRAGKPLKTATAAEPVQVQGLWRPTKVTMENTQEGSKTVISHDRGRDVNKGLDAGLFTKRALEKP